MQVKSMIANAGENLSDEQLKHVTGGARGNSRPDAAEAHLIEHGNLDLHGAAAADGCRLPPPPRPTPGPAAVMEKIQFSEPVTVQDLEDNNGITITGIDRIELFSNGELLAIHDFPGQPGHYEMFDLGDDSAGIYASQLIVNDAAAQGDQIKVTGFQSLPISLPDEG